MVDVTLQWTNTLGGGGGSDIQIAPCYNPEDKHAPEPSCSKQG